jgi:serine-type D-Ala-D-Ala carboxypeptidase (penicillin-binding protein 5/6)
MDAPSAYVLYQKNADMKVPIASTTKIMTATVVLDNYSDHLDDVVTITQPMVAVEGSDIQLRAGEKIEVGDLLKGLLIMSGNDAAYSLAIHFGGKDSFVKEMNDKAAFLGLDSTHYQCPAGLNDDGYSTAQDLANLTNYALKNPTFSSIVSTAQATIISTDGRFVHELKNSNRMLQADDPSYFPSALGVKTGFTYAAGHCLVSSTKVNGHQLIGVVLNTNESTITASAKESKKLMEWGFANWNWTN